MVSIILDILIIVLFLIIVFICAKRGFFKSVVRFLRLLLALIIAYFLCKPAGAKLDAAFIHGWVYNGVYNKIHALYESANEAFNIEKILALFPKFLLSDSMRQQIENSSETGEALVLSTSEWISTTLSGLISMILAFVLIFVIAFILLFFVSKLLEILIRKQSFISKIDHILGGLIGFVFTWSFFSMLCSALRFFFSDAAWYQSTYVMKFFAENPITKMISFLNFDQLFSMIFPK